MAAHHQGLDSHDCVFPARRMPQHTPDIFLRPTVPNPNPRSRGLLQNTRPPCPSQLGSEWIPGAQDGPYYAGSQFGPFCNSAFSPNSVFMPGRGVPTSSVRSAGASPVMFQGHGREILHRTLPEGDLGLASHQPPRSPVAGQPTATTSTCNCTEKPASTRSLVEIWRSLKHDYVKPRHRAQRTQAPSSGRLSKPLWYMHRKATNGTASPAASHDMDVYRGTTCNRSDGLDANLEIHEQNHQGRTAARFTSPASVFSANSADSGYISALDVPLWPRSSHANTSTSDAATPSFLTEDVLLRFCDMPLARTQLECDEATTSSDAYFGNGLKDGTGFVESRVLPTMNKVPSHWQLNKWQESEDDWERLLVFGTHGRSADLKACSSNASADPSTGTNKLKSSETLPRASTPTVEPGGSPSDRGGTHVGEEDEEMDADGNSRVPTPWPERWYEGGSELGLQQFAAEVIAECQGRQRDGEDTNDEIGTAKWSTDNDTEQQVQEDTRSPRTTGASSTSNQTTHPGGQSFTGHSTKRPRSNDDGDNEDSRFPKRRDAKRLPGSDASLNKFYACQYHKRNPRQSPFCGMPHGSKRDFGWNSVSRVKQHLLESHGLDHHCRNCWKAYKKVQDAESCHETRKCVQRTTPPKHWLSETQIAQLKAERVTSQSDEAWYRIADILFGSERDYSPESFRAEHTPYHDQVNHVKRFPEEPSPYRSPDSMWTPISDSTNPPGSTPMPGDQNVAPAIDPAEDGASALGTDPLPYQQAREYYNQPGPEAAITVINEAPGPVVDHPELVAVPTCTPAHDYAAAPETGYFLPAPPLLHETGHQDFEAAAMGGLEQFFDLGPAAAAGSAPTTTSTSTATHNPAPIITAAASHPPRPPPTCTCGHTPRCVCRLKKRVADLRRENETMRGMLGGLRQMLDGHEEWLQGVEEQGVLPGGVVGGLWEWLDQVRGLVNGGGDGSGSGMGWQ